MKRYLALALVAVTAAGCEGFQDAMTAHTDVVARAGGHELSVNDVVDLLAGQPRIPATTEVVSSLTDLWVDYTLLAEALAHDSTLSQLDLQPMLQQYVEQRTFMQLRDSLTSADTVFTDAELRKLFDEQAPGLRVHARHILLTFPDSATQAQRDSVWTLARQIRERAVAGEDFATLAREYSQDPGSAQQGGDLGWFESGSMVKPFEEAAFKLQPGEISPVTETLFGLHIIKVEERQTPSFEDQAPQFRRQMVTQRQQQALKTYVDSLTGPVGLEVQKGAYDVARDLASNPSQELSGRAVSRSLVKWKGGALTAGEFQRFMRRLPPQQRAQFSNAEDQQLESVLNDIATNELVLADAEKRGITVPQEERDSLATVMRLQIAGVARQAGLAGPSAEGETGSQAVERRVRSLLQGIVAGEQNVLPLGPLSYVLRQKAEWRVYERAFPNVVEKLEARRDQAAGQNAQPSPPSADTGAAAQQSDTAAAPAGPPPADSGQ